MKIEEREKQSLKTLEEQIIKKYTEKRAQIRDRNKNIEREIAVSQSKLQVIYVVSLAGLSYMLNKLVNPKS